MTPLVLTIVPLAFCIGMFLLGRVWLARQSDRLAARHRGLGVVVWIVALLISAVLIRCFLVPGSASTGRLAPFLGFMLLFAIWQRRRLSRELHERRNSTGA
jgi:hypothetical protein